MSFDGPIVYGDPIPIEDEGAYFYSMKVNEPEDYNMIIKQLSQTSPDTLEHILKLVKEHEEGTL